MPPAQPVHEVELALDAKVPAAHSVHDAAPFVLLYEPTAHGEQPSFVTNEPGPHVGAGVVVVVLVGELVVVVVVVFNGGGWAALPASRAASLFAFVTMGTPMATRRTMSRIAARMTRVQSPRDEQSQEPRPLFCSGSLSDLAAVPAAAGCSGFSAAVRSSNSMPSMSASKIPVTFVIMGLADWIVLGCVLGGRGCLVSTTNVEESTNYEISQSARSSERNAAPLRDDTLTQQAKLETHSTRKGRIRHAAGTARSESLDGWVRNVASRQALCIVTERQSRGPSQTRSSAGAMNTAQSTSGLCNRSVTNTQMQTPMHTIVVSLKSIDS